MRDATLATAATSFSPSSFGRPSARVVMHGEECSVNKDQLKGQGRQLAGKAMELAGAVTGNKRTESEARAQQDRGRLQVRLGDAKAGIKDIVRKVKRRY